MEDTSLHNRVNLNQLDHGRVEALISILLIAAHETRENLPKWRVRCESRLGLDLGPSRGADTVAMS